MEIIAKISKGTKMDQVYIPKNRTGLATGSYVILKPLDKEPLIKKFHFYNIKHIEPIKLDVIRKMINTIDKIANNQNVIITGSFLDKGFNFNDIDIIIINKTKLDINSIKRALEDKIGIESHIILLNNEALNKGLQTDPLYQMLLSRYISKIKFVYKIQNKINYRILDLHLLKSKPLINNFDLLNGDEKYYLIRNMTAIHLFLEHKKINKEIVDKEIIKMFNLKNIDQIKLDMLNKNVFLKKYKIIYEQTSNKIIENIAK